MKKLSFYTADLKYCCTCSSVGRWYASSPKCLRILAIIRRAVRLLFPVITSTSAIYASGTRYIVFLKSGAKVLLIFGSYNRFCIFLAKIVCADVSAAHTHTSGRTRVRDAIGAHIAHAKRPRVAAAFRVRVSNARED